ncbi:RfaG Glycosyltransferase [Burkholderiaceae bacterium]
MKVLYIVSNIFERSSGISIAVIELCTSLVKKNLSIDVIADRQNNIFDRKFQFPLKTFSLGLGPKKLSNSPDMLSWMKGVNIWGQYDIIHIHTMWQFIGLYPFCKLKKFKAKIISSPHGSLTSWSMRSGSRLKTFFWFALQYPALKKASCFHVTSEDEYEDLRKLGFKQPIAIIPLGVVIPSLFNDMAPRDNKVLFLSRLHPKKGLEPLLIAWKIISQNFPEWTLEIYGGDSIFESSSGYLSYLKKICRDNDLERVNFHGPIFGNEKLIALQSASIFVLPTYSENFGIVVAEALASATPVIVTKAAPWQGLIDNGCGWWIDIGSPSLIESLKSAMSMDPNALRGMGVNGREWMTNEFEWSVVAQKMLATYSWLLDKSLHKPSWIRLT